MTESTMRGLRYRSEIDGLRAVAVLPVVAFHANLGCPGGFVGVDVFFVISGYLITSLILEAGAGFSLAAFWERRVRRIFPAAAVTVLATLIAGWFCLFPFDFVRLGRSVIAQGLLVSNLFFWRDVNYFASDEVRPLLHTWSLAVEEQFYLFLPFLMFVLRRASRRTIVFCLAGCTALSFAASIYGLQGHASATFYLLPTRAWELLVGSLLAALSQLKIEQRWVNELVSGAGLLSILGATCLYTTDTPFPGTAALLPCLGAAAVILGTTAGATWTGRLLAVRPLVWVGSLSYSLYLWHWPLLTFARYELRTESPICRVVVVCASLLLAWISWRFVEQPVRKRVLLGERRTLFAVASVATLAAILTGVAIVRSEGVPSRWRSSTLQYAAGKLDFDFRVDMSLDSAKRGDLTRLGIDDARLPVELLVWGDSHAMAVLHVVDVTCRERGWRCLSATHSETLPLVDVPAHGGFSLGSEAPAFARAVVDFVSKQRVRRVLLVATWAKYDELNSEELGAGLRQTVRALGKSGASVAILKDVPFPGFDVPRALAQADASGQDVNQLDLPLAGYRALNRRVDAIMDGLPSSSVLILDPTSSYCDATELCAIERAGHALYFDRHHLSTHGAMQLKPLIEQLP